ncbi:MAG: N-acetyltransferase [Leptolyngbya sp. PLA1]|nr:N-acetyltransferase [Leptolyngbya sp. PLA1]
MSRREDHGAYFLSDDPAILDLDAVHAYLTRSYWSEGIGRDLVARAAAASLCYGIYGPTPRALQVGFARVITDTATYAYLCDVYVLEECRGRGLSKALMAFVLADPRLQGLRRFALMTRDAQGLYAKFGFGPMADPTRYMEIARPGMYLAPRQAGPGSVTPGTPPRSDGPPA